jgi:GH24 family phage-related lysozyme (muramidase)
MKTSAEGKALIKKFEGCELESYLCPAGVWTVGSLPIWGGTYNLGPTNLKSSTMLKVLNDNNYDEVPAQMRRWNKSNGEVLTGLVRRREAESLLFQGKEWHEV